MSELEEFIAAFPPTMKLPQEMRTLYEQYEWHDKDGLAIASSLYASPQDDDDIIWRSGGKRMLGSLATLFHGSQKSFCAWRADGKRQPVVCLPDADDPWVVAVDTLQFFRFLAIGYVEVCGGDIDQPPQSEEDYAYTLNSNFPPWVAKTFGVTIPKTGRAIYDEAQTEFGDAFAAYWREHNDL